MAAPINTSSTGENWHLSVDDLLAPLPEMARLGGPGPFVINLSASSAPVSPPVKGIAGCQHAHVYQVQRMEDRRPRYRLRLGPFANEDEADAILKKVRDIYPGALTATADADDLRAIANLRAKANAQQLPAEKLAGSPPPAVEPASSAMPRASVTPPAAAKPTAEQRVPVVRAPVVVPTLSAPVPVLVPHQAEQLGKRGPSHETAPTASSRPALSSKPALSTKPAPSAM